MKKFQVSVTGIHCSGCENLIKLSFEDAGLLSPSIEKAQTISFQSDLDENELQQKLKLISEDLSNYSFTNLKTQA